MEKIVLYVFLNVMLTSNGLSTAQGNDSSPVLVWTLDRPRVISTNASPLGGMASEEFGKILNKLVKLEYQLLVFVEKYLNVEDFLVKNKYGEDCFQKLKVNDRNSITYFPKVYGTMKALETVTDKYLPKKYNILTPFSAEKENDILRNIVTGNDTFVIINFFQMDSPHVRSTFLEHHDKIIYDMCKALEQVRRIVCIYMGLHSHKYNLESTEEEKNYVRYARQKRSFSENATEGDTFSLSSFDVPLVSEKEVEGRSGSCELDCTYEASDEGTSIFMHLASAPTLWYGNQEIVLNKFVTAMTIVNETLIILKVRTKEASVSFNFQLMPSGNWLLSGVVAEIKDADIVKRAHENEYMGNVRNIIDDSPDVYGDVGQIRMASDYPLMARTNRILHCLFTEFTGLNIARGSPRAQLYLYKVDINAQFPRSAYMRAGNGSQGNETYLGVDYCIPFATAAVLMAFINISSMTLLVTVAVAMLMSAKSNDKWDSAPHKALLRE